MNVTTPVDGGGSTFEQARLADQAGPAVDGGLFGEVERLLQGDCVMQRRAALCLQRMQRRDRASQFQKAIARMKKASAFRRGQAWMDAAVGVASAVAKAYCGPAAGALLDVSQNAVQRLGLVERRADALERRSLVARQQAEVEGEAAGALEGWLASARELERRMVDRLDALQRAEHEERVAALRA